MKTYNERRAVAARLREEADYPGHAVQYMEQFISDLRQVLFGDLNPTADYSEIFARLADLIEPSYKPDAEYEAWYNSLSHFGDERGGPSTIRELIEEIVWTALTVDLGPNGNTDSIGVDEGRVYTDKLFSEWERDALRLSGGCDRDALLELADEMDGSYPDSRDVAVEYIDDYARRIREACGVER